MRNYEKRTGQNVSLILFAGPSTLSADAKVRVRVLFSCFFHKTSLALPSILLVSWSLSQYSKWTIDLLTCCGSVSPDDHILQTLGKSEVQSNHLLCKYQIAIHNELQDAACPLRTPLLSDMSR